MSLIYALAQHSTRRDTPFLHWEIERPLTTEVSHEVVCAFAPIAHGSTTTGASGRNIHEGPPNSAPSDGTMLRSFPRWQT